MKLVYIPGGRDPLIKDWDQPKGEELTREKGWVQISTSKFAFTADVVYSEARLFSILRDSIPAVSGGYGRAQIVNELYNAGAFTARLVFSAMPKNKWEATLIMVGTVGDQINFRIRTAKLL